MTTKIAVTREVTKTETVSEVDIDHLIVLVGDALHNHICGRFEGPSGQAFDLFNEHNEIAAKIVSQVFKL